jgi:hypothetical protein
LEISSHLRSHARIHVQCGYRLRQAGASGACPAGLYRDIRANAGQIWAGMILKCSGLVGLLESVQAGDECAEAGGVAVVPVIGPDVVAEGG